MTSKLTRRELLVRSAAVAAGAPVLAAAARGTALDASPADASPADAPPADGKIPFRYSLNMGTLLGHKLSVAEEVEVAAKAGYSGVELWVRNLRKYVDDGKSLADLRKRIADLGLTVEGAIGFAVWAVDDDDRRAKGLEEFRQDMDLVAQVGGLRVAAPPAGINRTAGVDLNKVAERYRTVLELARQRGLVAELEIWGSALTLGRASEAAYVALQADHPDACLLLDAFHLYRGGSGFDGVRLLSGEALHVLHINDYPADPPRQQITDAYRVYPGDGVAPLGELFRNLRRAGFHGALSLELFNQEYWKQDPLVVAKTGLQKTRAAVEKAFA